MAFSLKRLILWFVPVAALITAAAYASFVEAFRRNASHRATYSDPLMEARRQASRLELAVRTLSRRDSIARALRARPAAAGLTVIVPANAPAAVRTGFEAEIRETWRSYVGDAAKVPVTILVSEQPLSTSNNQRERSHALAPAATDGRSCVAVLMTAPFRGGRGVSFDGLRDRPREIIAMCALLARHGPPGPGIARWLGSENWQAASHAPTLRSLRNPENYVDPRNVDQPRSAGRYAVANITGTPEWFSEGQERWRLGYREIKCLAGRGEFCAATLHSAEPADPEFRDPLLPRTILRTPRGWTRDWRRALVVNIERSLGPQKFAQFWASAKSPEEALVELHPGGAAALIKDRLMETRHPVVGSPWPSAMEWLLIVMLLAVPTGLMLLANRQRSLKAA